MEPRTGAKTEALSRLSLSVAQSVEESIRQADIVVVNLSDYSSTRQFVRRPDLETALRGKIVVQLKASGTPPVTEGNGLLGPPMRDIIILTAPLLAIRQGSEQQPARSSLARRAARWRFSQNRAGSRYNLRGHVALSQNKIGTTIRAQRLVATAPCRIPDCRYGNR